ncbi:hypothetical protein CISG_06772 [Coccidioides immitis RMSCC 3703]|uniref:Uncharacterized protein n=1 Tax=Coccidioides immitis RMSCC 3703 TaxID=454286 RepID=A0A0J8QYF6_COCIT|nr:hypothetical protein CISG_06772 [Coccidioides immitis RMSCC 3703]
MHYEQEPTWFQMNSLVEYWKSELQGLSDDGWVRTEAYEDVVKKNMELKKVLWWFLIRRRRSDAFKSNGHFRIMKRRLTDKFDALQTVGAVMLLQ